MNTRELDRLLALLAENAVFHFPGTEPIEGPARIERFLKILFHRYPRLEFTVSRVIADHKSAAVEWRNQGQDRSGSPYNNAGVTIVELAADRIVYLSDTFKDTASFSKK
jgi:ketosteroid isomerase-like protein